MKHEAKFVQEGKQMHITREFNASVEKVWKAWTTAELLDKWWAPRPYVNDTKALEFTESGHWLYSMTGPQGDKHWCREDYQSIDPQTRITSLSNFCDQEGVVEKPFPNSTWDKRFIATETGAKVEIVITHDTEESLQQVVEMGFKGGFSMGLNNLDEVLEEL